MYRNNGEFLLSEMKEGDSAIIVSVPAHSLFAPLGIRKNKRIKLDSRHPFSGPVLLGVDGRQIAVSQHITHEIIVRK